MGSATQLIIHNLALRLLGSARISAVTDETEPARILNDMYVYIRDEVLASHPWNFASFRGSLTELGGTITGWTESSTSDVWQASLTTTPSLVKFDGTEGTKKTSVAACTSARDWYYDSSASLLYVYSTSDADTAYTTIKAQIPEFGYDNAFQNPSDCLRVIRMKDDDSKFEIEGDRLFTDESAAKILYIKQITDTTKFSPAFVTVLAQRLAAEAAYPITNSITVADAQMKSYNMKLKNAKSIDAQEGSGYEIDEDDWEDARA